MKITQALDNSNADATSNITEIEELPESKILFRIVYKVKWGDKETKALSDKLWDEITEPDENLSSFDINNLWVLS